MNCGDLKLIRTLGYAQVENIHLVRSRARIMQVTRPEGHPGPGRAQIPPTSLASQPSHANCPVVKVD